MVELDKLFPCPCVSAIVELSWVLDADNEDPEEYLA